MGKKLQEHCKTLEYNNKISRHEFESIFHINTRHGILYELPKVHKVVIDNIPKFWPILSPINTPVFKLAEFLVPLLLPLTVDNCIVTDSFSFAKEVINFDHGETESHLSVRSREHLSQSA